MQGNPSRIEQAKVSQTVRGHGNHPHDQETKMMPTNPRNALLQPSLVDVVEAKVFSQDGDGEEAVVLAVAKPQQRSARPTPLQSLGKLSALNRTPSSKPRPRIPSQRTRPNPGQVRMTLRLLMNHPPKQSEPASPKLPPSSQQAPKPLEMMSPLALRSASVTMKTRKALPGVLGPSRKIRLHSGLRFVTATMPS